MNFHALYNCSQIRFLLLVKESYLLIITAVLYLVLTGGMFLAKGADIESILKLDTGGHTAKTWDLVVTNDKRYLISASDDKTIRVWDMGTRNRGIGIGLRIKEQRKILGQIGSGIEGAIYAIALSPDNKHLAVSGRMANNSIDGPAIRIYNFSIGRLKKVLKSHINVVYDLAFSNDGRYLVSGSADRSVKVWDAKDDYKLVHTFKEHNNFVYAVKIFRYRNDYHIVSAGEDNNVFLYSFKKRRVLNSFTHSHKLNYLAISMDYIAVCGKDKSINIFDLSLNQLKTIASETQPTGLAFSPNGRLLLAGFGSLPPNCNIYDIRNNFKEITSFKKHDNLTRAVAFLDDSTVITCGGDSYGIYLWDAYTGGEKAHITGDGNTVWSVGINGKEIAFGNTNEHNDDVKFEKTISLDTFSISDIEDTSRFRRITTRYDNYKLRHAKGGDYGYEDAVLVIKKGWWEDARIVRGAYDGYKHRTYGFTDDAVIISGGSNGVLKAYNLKGKETASFIGHSGEVCSIATQGDWLVSGSADQTMILWNLRGIKQGKSKIYPTLSMFVSKDDEWVVWSNKGYYNSSVGGDKYIGYHVNQGADREAYFYSSDKFFNASCRPDIIENLIKLGSEE